jgi:hypothetical protein
MTNNKEGKQSMEKRFKWHFVYGLLLGLTFVHSAWGLSNNIRFQGRLTDSTGRPIVGTPQVSFGIFNASTGGNPLWGPTSFQNVNANESGLFATDLGPFTDLSIFSGSQDLYLQVTVLGGTGQTTQVLSPRQKLGSVPFAFYSQVAASATTAGSATVATSVPDNTITSSNIQNGAITTNKIQQGAIGSDQIADHTIQQVDLSTAIVSQFIPSGMIAMFAQACPTGWTRFSQLDSRFPLGTPAYTGSPAGSSMITGLTTSMAGSHSHKVDPHVHKAGASLQASGPVPLSDVQFKSGGTSKPANQITSLTLPVTGQTELSDASVGTSTAGDHQHIISSDGFWLPPYLGVVYCEKD